MLEAGVFIGFIVVVMICLILRRSVARHEEQLHFQRKSKRNLRLEVKGMKERITQLRQQEAFLSRRLGDLEVPAGSGVNSSGLHGPAANRSVASGTESVSNARSGCASLADALAAEGHLNDQQLTQLRAYQQKTKGCNSLADAAVHLGILTPQTVAGFRERYPHLD